MRGPIPDKPRQRPSVAELQPLVDAYYQFPNCGVGGHLHAVVDDGNWEDIHIQSVIDTAEHYDERRPREWECARALARLLILTTRTQRRRIEPGYDGAPMTREAFLVRCDELLKRYVS